MDFACTMACDASLQTPHELETKFSAAPPQTLWIWLFEKLNLRHGRSKILAISTSKYEMATRTIEGTRGWIEDI
jgi:hypothetical protein